MNDVEGINTIRERKELRNRKIKYLYKSRTGFHES
jgi:hypothetical protein